MSNLEYPVCGQVYSLKEIETSLELVDSPFLRVYIEGFGIKPIQTSHVAVNLSKAIPELADSKWTYQRTTNEEIPLFLAVDPDSVLKFLTFDIDARTSEFNGHDTRLLKPKLPE